MEESVSEDSVQLKSNFEEKVAEIFRIFDGDHRNRVNENAVGFIFRMLGLVPSEDDIENCIKATTGIGDLIHFNSFLAHLFDRLKENRMQPPLSAENILELFKCLDTKNRGYILKDEFEAALKLYGEPMEEEEIKEMMNAAVSLEDENKIDYYLYASKLAVKEVEGQETIFQLAAVEIKNGKK